MRRLWIRRALILGALFFTFSTQASSIARTQLAQYQDLPGWNSNNPQKAIVALKKSCKRAMKRAKGNIHRFRGGIDWYHICNTTLALPNALSAESARQFIEAHFQPYQVTDFNREATGLFTGYYEPTIPGSLQKTPYYGVPIYGKPVNLVRVRLNGRRVYRLKIDEGRYQRMGDRATIEAGPILPHTPILAWVHSKVDRFFLQIQGSGSITLPNGDRLLLGYNGQNGYPYYPIGKYLIDQGDIKKSNVTMQTIKAWLNAHPEKAQPVMNMNPSFVFFRKLDVENPIGAEGVELTPGYSIAVDPDAIAYGTPVWISTHYPKSDGKSVSQGSPLNRLFIAQDTGGAIKGAVRSDIFWGNGERAEWLAGHMQSMGQYWVLLPK